MMDNSRKRKDVMKSYLEMTHEELQQEKEALEKEFQNIDRKSVV